MLVAWWAAIGIVADAPGSGAEMIDQDLLDIIKRSQISADALFVKFGPELKDKGWETDDCAFEVPSSGRIRVKH